MGPQSQGGGGAVEQVPVVQVEVVGHEVVPQVPVVQVVVGLQVPVVQVVEVVVRILAAFEEAKRKAPRKMACNLTIGRFIL